MRKGTKVKVIHGMFKNLQGKVWKSEPGKITVFIDLRSKPILIEFPPEHLEKV